MFNLSKSEIDKNDIVCHICSTVSEWSYLFAKISMYYSICKIIYSSILSYLENLVKIVSNDL